MINFTCYFIATRNFSALLGPKALPRRQPGWKLALFFDESNRFICAIAPEDFKKITAVNDSQK
jgi:hypothetical protein